MPYLIKYGIAHQATFIKTILLRKRPYDENLKILSDWNFFFECYLYENVVYRKIDYNVVCYEGNGISFTNHDLLVKEYESFLNSIPASILLKEYKIIPLQLCEQFNLISNSYRFIRLLTKFNVILIQIYLKLKPKACIK